MTFVIVTGQRLIWRTGLYCHPDHWDKSSGRVGDKYLEFDEDYFDINDRLDQLQSFVLSTYRVYRREQRLYQLTKDKLRSLIKDFWQGEDYVPDVGNEVLNYYQYYVASRKEELRIASNTKEHDTASLNKFIAFHEELSHPATFTGVSISLFEAYRNHLWKDGLLADSTVYKHLSRFKDMLIRAQIEGKLQFNVKAISLSHHLNLSRRAKETVALTKDQIDKLMDLDLSDSSGLSDIRYLFIAACYTGLRFNRWGEMNKRNLVVKNGYKYLEMFTVKGSSKRVVVPVHPRLEEIAQMYDWVLPAIYTGQYVNRSLDEICKRAGFTRNIRRVVRKRGRDSIETIPFNKLVRTHTARRTFVTIALASSMDIDDVQAITTHSSRQMVEHYSKEAPIAKAERLRDHPFFQIRNNA